MRSIIGIGTLLCEESAHKTCPSLRNFRPGIIEGYKRVFNKVDPYHATKLGKNIANISAVRDQPTTIKVTIFDISEDDWNALSYREFEYNFMLTPYVDEAGKHGGALICGSYADNKSCMKDVQKCPNRMNAYNYYCSDYVGELWRDDILPNPEYIEKCLSAASTLGNDYVENFLETTWLADGSQNLKRYLSR